MLFAISTTLDKVKQVPLSFWLNAVIVVLCLVVLVLIFQRIKEMNKIILLILLGFILSLVGLNWIYQRNEPRFLTPAIDFVAPFLPSKSPSPATHKAPPPPPKKNH